MRRVAIEVDAELAGLLAPRRKDMSNKATELMALELYRMRHISSGKAASFLGMHRAEFIRYASRQGISFFDMEADELRKDAAIREVPGRDK